MKKLLIAAISFLALTTSCEKEDSVDVNQDRIYTAYEVFYNQNTDKTTVIARFKFGGPTGTNLELSDGAYCTFNGDTLYYNNLWFGHMKEYAGNTTSGSFYYQDVNGSAHANSPLQMDTIGHDLTLDTIIKSQANTLTWQGSALAYSEHVNLYIGSWTWGEDALMFQGQQGATNIVIGTNQTSGLALGSASIHLERVRSSNSIQGTSEGGVIRSRYKPLNKNVIVVQ